MTKASLDSIRRVVTVQWPQATNVNAKALLLKVARNGHAAIMAQQSAAPPDWDAYANREGNTNLDTVVLPGPIVYRYRYFREVVKTALDELRKASPVRSGAYVRSHTVYLNGQPQDTLPVKLSLGDELFIANPVPYARRIEVGVTESGRAFVIQVQPHVYERVARLLATRFRNTAKISFGYVDLPDAQTITGAMASRTPRVGGRKRRNHAGSAVKAPAIFIQGLV